MIHRLPVVGQVAELSRTIGADDIALFTLISGDRNPLHYDEAAAKASRFGEIVVQGGVTSAILNAVVAEKLPGPGTVFLNVNWSFRAPVRPGDTITGRVEVISVRTDKPITQLKTTVLRDDGTVVLDGTVPDHRRSRRHRRLVDHHSPDPRHPLEDAVGEQTPKYASAQLDP
ncbi:acyl dehydratase [Mycobacterium decipiens]|uniref:Acyl dehydratase n=1 Tax=Mycobacterium decipiens TaxID=1430326 RepID=A0A1X2LYY5_9MYCO|nr:acyl dehydratase [Mycobacterium decipiens]